MNRTPFAVLLVLAVTTTFAGAEDRKPKPGYVGVMIAYDKDRMAVFVMSVVKDGPADRAGLMGGDLVLRIDGIKAGDLETAVKVIRAQKPGRKIKLLIERNGKEKELDLTPGTMG